MVPPTSDEVRSTRGAAPDTVMVSSMAPIVITMSRSSVRPTPMAKSGRSNEANPASWAVMRNVPGSICPAKKLPSALETTSRNVPVS